MATTDTRQQQHDEDWQKVARRTWLDRLTEIMLIGLGAVWAFPLLPTLELLAIMQFRNLQNPLDELLLGIFWGLYIILYLRMVKVIRANRRDQLRLLHDDA